MAADDLTSILRNIERTSRDTRDALAAMDRSSAAMGLRLDAMVDQIAALEGRLTGVERRIVAIETDVNSLARHAARTEQLLADIAKGLPKDLPC